MNPAQLLAHFDRISEAPDAIPTLRRFILDLAVRGKLVEQDPNDEPAAELVRQMRSARAAQVRMHHPQSVDLPANGDGNGRPFAVPSHWDWVQLQDMLPEFQNGESSRGSLAGIQRVVLRLADIKDGRISLADTRTLRVTPEAAAKYRLARGDVLVIRVNGSAELVGRFIVCVDETEAVYCDHFIRLRVRPQWAAARFVGLLGNSPLFRDQIGILFVTTAGQKTVNQGHLGSLLMPLPPLAEQYRIVAKVDELMALCDRLEAAQAERENRRERLVAASLSRLNQCGAGDAQAFRDHARFHLMHIPRLTTSPEHIHQLRQTILNLAVRGQLVTQDPNDEPAYELLKRIQMEKVRLASEGKIAHQDPPIPASANELAFDLKPGWQAARISQILVELQTGPFGSSLHQSDYQKRGTPVINPASIRNGRLVPIDSMAVGPATSERLANFRLRRGDIVMGRRGEMGRCAVVTDQEDGWLCGTGSLILRLPGCVFPAFLATLIGSPFARDYLGGSAVGATMQNLNQSILRSLVIGLPPLPEQHRIVAKVDEVMAVCDRLTAQLTTAQIESCCLLEAVLHQALEPAA